ncbi:MAG TPA: RebB family R body protein [Rhodocyclaceae bacterium]
MSKPAIAVQPQVTDAVTQAAGQVLGAGPVVALLNAYMAQAQAQAVLAANTVSQQQHQALVGMAVTLRSVRKLLRGGRAAPRAAKPMLMKTAGALPPEDTAPPPAASPSPMGPGMLAVW